LVSAFPNFIDFFVQNITVSRTKFFYTVRGFPEVRPGPLTGKETNWQNKTWTK